MPAQSIMVDEVSDFLDGAVLQDYTEQCKRHGYNDLQAIMALDIRTLEFIDKVHMEPDDVLQLRRVLLRYRRLSNSPATWVSQTRANAVAEIVDTVIAPPVPPSSASFECKQNAGTKHKPWHTTHSYWSEHVQEPGHVQTKFGHAHLYSFGS